MYIPQLSDTSQHQLDVDMALLFDRMMLSHFLGPEFCRAFRLGNHQMRIFGEQPSFAIWILQSLNA